MTDLAAALLRDVERHHVPRGLVLYETEVLAALSRALDPALTERAGEVLSRLRKADEYEPLGHDGWETADLITALLTANAALVKYRDAYAEMERIATEALRKTEARAEAAEAQIAILAKIEDNK